MGKWTRFLLLLSASGLVMTTSAEAKLFRNSYVSFQMPPAWKCQSEGTEWVCVSQFNKRSKEALIILTAKEVGPTDNIAGYLTYLKTPRTLPSRAGGSSQSKVLHVRQRQISDHVWVDGMHLGSEVPSYYTRYLATIKNRIAILVTFSAHKRYYTKYSQDFLKAISSLRVTATKNLLAQRPNLAVRPSYETIGAPIGSHLALEAQEDLPEEGSSKASNWMTKILGLLLLVIAVGLYFYTKASPKKRKKKGAKKSSRSSR